MRVVHYWLGMRVVVEMGKGEVKKVVMGREKMLVTEVGIEEEVEEGVMRIRRSIHRRSRRREAVAANVTASSACRIGCRSVKAQRRRTSSRHVSVSDPISFILLLPFPRPLGNTSEISNIR